MIEIFKKWVGRYLAQEESLILLFLLLGIALFFSLLGSVLVPVLTGVVLAYVMQGRDQSAAACPYPIPLVDDHYLSVIFGWICRVFPFLDAENLATIEQFIQRSARLKRKTWDNSRAVTRTISLADFGATDFGLG